MAKKVKALIGKVRDGDDQNSPEDTLAKKIANAITDATNIYSCSVSKWGKLGLAIVVYEG